MKSRLLAVLLSISMLFSSIPVSAAETAGMNVTQSESSIQEEITEGQEDTTEDQEETEIIKPKEEETKGTEDETTDVPESDDASNDVDTENGADSTEKMSGEELTDTVSEDVVSNTDVEYSADSDSDAEAMNDSVPLGTSNVKLSKVGDGETNAYDFVRTYKIDSEEILEGNYSLELAYLNDSGDNAIFSSIELNTDNNYQETIMTAAAQTLDPDTEYDLRWTLYDDSRNVVNIVYETVHTLKPRIILDKKDSQSSSQEYQISLDDKDTANFETATDISLDIYAFIRKKGSENYYQAADVSLGQYNQYGGLIKITDLDPDTEYEFMLRSSNKSDMGMEYAADTFTTGADTSEGQTKISAFNYELDFAVDEKKTTNNKAVISVSAGNTRVEDERIKVILSLDNGQQQTVTLNKSKNFKNDVVFTELIGETKYTIVKAVFSSLECRDYVEAGERDCTFEFTTKAPEIPKSITLSENKLFLNVANVQTAGGDYYSLKAEAVPAAASADFEWESSDTAVATVNDGRVNAKGVGNAIITVKSKYDSNISASCEVTVKNYLVGYQVEGKPLDIIRYYRLFSVYKNAQVKGFDLYECNDDGSFVLLSDYNVTSIRPEIASWKEGRLYANSVGSTELIFEKDGYKAKLKLEVNTEGKGFGIKNITTTQNEYPAIKESDGSYTLAYTAGISYTANVEVSPKQYISSDDFKWTISNTDIAEVNDTGVITPKGEGDVDLTIEARRNYNIDDLPYKNNSIKLTLHIKNLPTSSDTSELYALANVNSKIGDVKFPANWGEGWSWKYPDTPLLTNAVNNNNVYPFEAVYSGAKSYPVETTISVHIGRITGVSVEETSTDHNHVLEVGDNDAIKLELTPLYQGSVSPEAYEINIPDINGLNITKNENGSFSIKASKKGNYTLKPVIKAKGTSTVLASTSYKIKAVEDKQVGSIVISSETDGVKISGNKITFASVDAKKDFTLKAVVKDRYGENIKTALTWKTTDKTVATAAPVSKSDTHSANVKVKGGGHTVIMVTAKDSSGYLATLNLEVQDHTPRVDVAKASVNMAYDYDDYNGKGYAYDTGGAVEIVPVYGENITTVELRNQNGGQKLTNLTIERYKNNAYLVQPLTDNLEKGTYNCTIFVKTNAGGNEGYKFPLKVSVTDKSPRVSAKMTDVPNLFLKYSSGYIDLNISGGYSLDSSSVTWEDESIDADNGFIISCNDNLPKKLIVSQKSGLKVVNAKLLDDKTAKGKLRLKLRGYKKTYEFNNFTIKYKYKKPVLVTQNASSNIFPSIGKNESRFGIYDKTNDKYMYFYESGSIYTNSYDEIKCDSDDVILNTDKDYVNYTYNGQSGNKKIKLTLDSMQWREPVSVTHTIKVIKPKAYLEYGQITLNTNFKSKLSNNIYLKDKYRINYTNIEIKGANAKSQKLLDDDLFVITSERNAIAVEQSQADFMGAKIPAGVYSYKITPSYKKPDTGETVTLNTMTLKIKVINKAVTAKVSPKGSLDLTYGAYYYEPVDKKNVAVLVNPKFSNYGSGYSIESYKLTGAYRDYFTLDYGWIKYNNKYSYNYYIKIKDNHDTRKLKAKQAYKLAIEYKITNNNGESFVVTSNTFTIKPKQSSPKIKVKNNNQTLYAGAAGNLTRTYYLSVPDCYAMTYITGGLDCNKDGINDITVASGFEGNSVVVRINDRDAVLATANGKSYSIPITVRLQGSDGIAKNVKITIKVKIKR
ncbi:MAG: Ig-like domain-containing protein [Lachnospiraceae bacterium]|nr:Ig-like domain-containing protein [Lachnospiraceae bacterium]